MFKRSNIFKTLVIIITIVTILLFSFFFFYQSSILKISSDQYFKYEHTQFRSFANVVKQISFKGNSNIIFANFPNSEIVSVQELPTKTFFVEKKLSLKDKLDGFNLLDVALRNNKDLYIVSAIFEGKGLSSSKLSVLRNFTSNMDYEKYEDLLVTKLESKDKPVPLFNTIFFPQKDYTYNTDLLTVNKTPYQGDYTNSINIGGFEVKLDRVSDIGMLMEKSFLENSFNSFYIRYPRYILENDVVSDDLNLLKVPEKIDFNKQNYAIPKGGFFSSATKIVTLYTTNSDEILITIATPFSTEPIRTIEKNSLAGFYNSSKSVNLVTIKDDVLFYEEISEK